MTLQTHSRVAPVTDSFVPNQYLSLVLSPLTWRPARNRGKKGRAGWHTSRRYATAYYYDYIDRMTKYGTTAVLCGNR